MLCTEFIGNRINATFALALHVIQHINFYRFNFEILTLEKSMACEAVDNSDSAMCVTEQFN